MTKGTATLHEEAAKGDADAIFQLGLMYWEGCGVGADFGEAKRLIGEAKRRNHPVADFYWDIICAHEEENHYA